MREITHLLRAAYSAKLSGLNIDGVAIPFKDSILFSRPALIPFAGGNVEAYVIIKNQMRGGNLPKNCVNFKTQLYLDVVTVFSGPLKTTSTSVIRERITDEIYQILFNDLRFTITNFNDYYITSTNVYEQPMAAQYNDTSTIFRGLISLTHNVSKVNG